MSNKRFLCYFWFTGWDHFSLGLHICWSNPNIELHVPFGFFRIGWCVCAQRPNWQWFAGQWERGFGYYD